jgi:hypothetical protein
MTALRRLRDFQSVADTPESRNLTRQLKTLEGNAGDAVGQLAAETLKRFTVLATEERSSARVVAPGQALGITPDVTRVTLSSLSAKDSGKLTLIFGNIATPAQVTVATVAPATIAGEPLTLFTVYGSLLFINDGANYWPLDNRAPFDITRFGASPSATGAVNSAALQEAMTLASAAKERVVVPRGTFVCSQQVSLPDGYHCELELQDGAVIDARTCTGIVSRDAFMRLGTETSGLTLLPLLAADAVKGESTVTLASAPSVSAGDLVIIHDTTDSSFNPSIIARVYYRNGEFKRVHSVAGSVLRFDCSLYDSYALANPNIVLYKVTTGYAHIHGGGKMIFPGLNVGSGGSGSDVGIQLWNAYRSKIEGVQLENAHFANLNVWRCFDTVISNVNALTEDIGGNGSAGAFVLSSYNVWFKGGTFQASKHGVSLTGGAVMASIPNRLCGALGSTLRGDLTAADMHGHGDRCQWLNCTIEGGCSIGGSNCAIMGGSVRSASDSYNVGTLRGLCIRIREAKGSSHTVDGVDCYIDHLSAQSGGDNPFAFQMYEAVVGGVMCVRNLRITANVHTAKVGYLGAVGRAVTFITPSFLWENNHHFGVVGQKETVLTIEGLDDGGSAAFDKIIIARSSGVSPQTTNVRTNEITYDDLDVEESDSFGVVAAVVQYPGVTQYINVLNVRTRNNDAAGIFVAANAASDDVYVTVRGCKSLNNGQDATVSGASKSSLRATNLQSLELSDNTWGDVQTVQTQISLYDVSSVTTLIGDGYRALGAPLQRAISLVANDNETLDLRGTGVPTGTIEGNIGARYIDNAGGAGVTLWVNEDGTNTGWAAK